MVDVYQRLVSCGRSLGEIARCVLCITVVVDCLYAFVPMLGRSAPSGSALDAKTQSQTWLHSQRQFHKREIEIRHAYGKESQAAEL